MKRSTFFKALAGAIIAPLAVVKSSAALSPTQEPIPRSRVDNEAAQSDVWTVETSSYGKNNKEVYQVRIRPLNTIHDDIVFERSFDGIHWEKW